jgi:HlyD family type I secretion membrane fusion protein
MSKTRSGDLDRIPDWKHPAIVGYVIITMTFVVLGGWAAYAELDSAVVASGSVAVESSRKTVQHLEGGIVRQIFVREGQRVKEAAVLFRLDPTPARAAFDLQQNQLDSALAHEARLVAERDDAAEMSFPEGLMERKEEPTVTLAIADQIKEFNERRASLAAQTDLIQSKIVQYKTEIEGLTAEREATNRQLKFINEELADLRGLLSKNLVPKSRVLSLEREASRLEGVVGRSIADQAKAQNGIGEADLQSRQLRQKFREDVSGQMLEARQKVADLREKVRVAGDVLRRIDVTAPVAGTVQSLKVSTVGGVIKPGESLLDIVPEHDLLIVQARIAPQDIDNVEIGMRAEVRFPSFHAQILPLMFGRVDSMSRDRLMDDSNKQPYFLAQVVLDDVPANIRERLSAGMQADLVFPTGERTVLDYLVRPLKRRLSSALREK